MATQQQQQNNPQQQQPVPVQHSIDLKVMRLRRPEFTTGLPINVDKFDWLPEKLATTRFAEQPPISDQTAVNGSVAPALNLDQLNYHDIFTLPGSFGKIYVGQVISSYISLHNNSYNDVRNVSIKVELSVGNTKTTLLDLTSSPIPIFAANTNHDFLVEHPLTESGQHVLICIVSYVDTEPKTLRKVYKFPVDNPIAMKAVKVYTFKEHVFLHLELQNTTGAPLYIEYVRLDQTFGLSVNDHSTHNKGKAFEHPMAPDEVRRFLYEITPTDPTIASSSPQNFARTMSTLGKIELQWRSSLGESGKLITNTIQHKGLVKPEIEVVVTAVSKPVLYERPFRIQLDIFNHTDNNTRLSMHFRTDKMFPLTVDGSSIKRIGELAPHGRVSLEVSLFALGIGVVTIGSGIEIHDTISGKVHSLTNLCQVVVEHEPIGE